MKSWKTHNGYEIIQLLAGRSNVFLILYKHKSLLVDTSTGFIWSTLQRRIQKLNVTEIDYLLLTHTHFDHVANAAGIKELYDAKVLVHTSEASCLANGKNMLPGGTNLFTRTLIKLLAKRVTHMVDYRPCSFDILVDSFFDLNKFGFNACILHTPGHSIGSVSLIVDNEIALVGDAMFGVFRRSIFPPFADDIKSMIESWGKLLDTGCSLYIPAHGTANSRQLLLNNYNKRLSALHSQNYN